MPTIDANGLTIGYEVSGAGPPLILLHGATTSGRDQFAALRPRLDTGFRVHAPDARGHGTTRWDPADGFTTDDLADDVEAFADALGLATFHLLGFSMGGMTALHVAARRPARLRTLVTIGITPEREPRATVGRALMDPARIERTDPRWAARLAARHDPVQGDGAWRRLLPAIVRDIAAQPLLTARVLRSIDAPTLVVVGDRDPFSPVAQAHALARQVRDGHLLVLPGVGHDVLTDAGEQLATALADFYRTTEPIASARSGEPADAATATDKPGLEVAR